MLLPTKMAGPPAKKPRTNNNKALDHIQDHDSLVVDDSDEDSVTVTVVAGLDDNNGSSSFSDNKDKWPTTLWTVVLNFSSDTSSSYWETKVTKEVQKV